MVCEIKYIGIFLLFDLPTAVLHRLLLGIHRFYVSMGERFANTIADTHYK